MMNSILVNKHRAPLSVIYLITMALTITQTGVMMWVWYTLNLKSEIGIPIFSNDILQQLTKIEARLISTNELLRDIRDDRRNKQ